MQSQDHLPSLNGLVSTIIPVHNRASLLKEAAASVLAQTYRPIEIIIVDDGSTDETWTVAEALASQHPEVTALRQANAGPGVAREAGRRRARGEFIQYLDSDDRLLPEKFALQVAALRREPGCGAAYGKTRYYDFAQEAPPQQAWKRTGERLEAMFPSFLTWRWWGTSTPLYRRSVCDCAGPWLPLINEEDWEYDCRIAALGTKLAYCDVFVSEQRSEGKDKLSRNGHVDPRKLRDRAIAHRRILQSARTFGVACGSPEMRFFSRALFLLARQCGAAGLSEESAELFQLSRDASAPDRAQGWDYRLYGAGARIVGWRAMGRWSDRVADRVRSFRKK